MHYTREIAVAAETASGSWDVVETTGFGTTHFYTRATDSHGHHQTIRSEIPPAWAAQIAELVQSPDMPEFKTSSDLFRAAILFLLNHLADSGMLSPERMTWVRSQRLEAERALEEVRLQEAKATAEGAERLLRELAMINDQAGIERECYRIREQARSAPNEFYRKRMAGLADQYER